MAITIVIQQAEPTVHLIATHTRQRYPDLRVQEHGTGFFARGLGHHISLYRQDDTWVAADNDSKLSCPDLRSAHEVLTGMLDAAVAQPEQETTAQHR